MDSSLVLGIANIIGVSVLALITAYYAYQTHQTVQEMKAAREDQARPFLKLSLAQISPEIAFPRVTNVGQGPAIDPKITISIADESKHDSKTAVFQLLMQNEYYEFIYPLDKNNRVMKLKHVAETWQTLTLKAECKDSFGHAHAFSGQIDIPEFRAYLNDTQVRFREDPTEKMANELLKIRQQLNS